MIFSLLVILARYDPDTRISETIESENDRVEFIMNITQVRNINKIVVVVGVVMITFLAHI